MTTAAAPIRYCRMCGKPEHGTPACNTVRAVVDLQTRYEALARRPTLGVIPVVRSLRTACTRRASR